MTGLPISASHKLQTGDELLSAEWNSYRKQASCRILGPVTGYHLAILDNVFLLLIPSLVKIFFK